jgi:hypothetical protein
MRPHNLPDRVIGKDGKSSSRNKEETMRHITVTKGSPTPRPETTGGPRPAPIPHPKRR